MRRSGIVAGLFALFMLLPFNASAQTLQLFSLQFSGLGSVPFGTGLEFVSAGYGWEGQLRINPSSSFWSFGFGVEQTFHDATEIPGATVTLTGGFFEPRRVIDIGSNSVALYIAGRAALSQFTFTEGLAESTANGFTLNGGGGLLIVLGSRANLDLGATVGYKKLGQTDIQGSLFDLGTGANAVLRAGLAIGLGG